MANKIQIKRSAINAVVPSLSNGEFGFTGVGDVLFIGAPDGSGNIRIAGRQYPGTLTANQALVANATLGIDKVITGNLTVITTANIAGVTTFGGNVILGNSTVTVGLQANGSYGSAGQSLISNGTASYWGTSTAVAGSNTQLQFNDSGNLGAVSGLTFIKTTNTISIGNSTVNSSINSSSFSGSANNASYVGGNTATDLRSYSDTAAGSAAATAYSNATSYADGKAATAYSNATSYADTKAGTAYSNAMSDTLSRNGSYAGNNIIGGTNTVFSSNVLMNGILTVNNNVNIKTTFNLTVGNSTANSILTPNSISISNSTTGNISLFSSLIDGAVSYGAAIQIGNPAAMGGPGGSTVYAPQGGDYSTTSNLFFTNTSLLQIGNSANFVNISGANSYFSGNVGLNGIITAGNNMVITGHIIPSANITYDLGNTTNAWRSLYIKGTTIFLGSLSIKDSDGGLAIATTVGDTVASLSSVANITVTTNTTTIGTSGYFVSNGNLGLGNNVPSDKLSVNGTTNLSGNVTIGGANIEATGSMLRIRDIIASGNLIVSGSVVTVNTTSLTVKDNVIELGTDNTTTDVVDTGFFSPAGDGTKIWYSGIARIAAASSNSNPVFRVFASNTNPNTATTIDTSANTATGTIQAYLQPFGSGGVFVVNSTAVTVTANSTVAVNITSNNITTSNLTVTSGAFISNSSVVTVTANSTVAVSITSNTITSGAITSGGLVANSIATNITATGSIAVAIAANTLSLTTALPSTSGGTSYNTYTSGDLLIANTGNALSKLGIGSDGYVLQVSSGSIIWNVLDGGTF